MRYPVAVVGAGALGLLYASRLARVVPTALIARSAERARTLRRGVRVGRTLYLPAVFAPDDLPQADWAIILVKGPDTHAAVRLARRLEPKRILSLQNGLVDAVPQGVSTAGAYREGRRVVVAATGRTLLPAGFAPLGRYLRRAGFTVERPRDLAAARHWKLLANVCINPVTALFGIRNGEVRRPPYAFLVQALAAEAAQVLGLPRGKALERVMEVAARTAGNRSSMLQDVLAGRRTEIDHLTGALLRLARRRRIAAPTHGTMRRLIRNFPRVRKDLGKG